MSKTRKLAGGLLVPTGQTSLAPATQRQAKVLAQMDRNNHSRDGASSFEGSELADIFDGRADYIGRSTGSKPTWGIRPATATETSAAILLSRRVDEINISGDEVTRVPQELPPGRLHVPAVIAARAARMNGELRRTKPYHRRMVNHAPRTRMTAGIVLDISGSQAEHAGLGAAVCWTIHSAVARVMGQTAMVAYSNWTYPLVAPGEPMPGVLHMGTSAGQHHLVGALDMLDAGTDLWDGDGARAMFLFGDGEIGRNSGNAARINEAAERGVHVVWIAPEDLDTWGVPLAGHPRIRVIRDAKKLTFPDLMGQVGDALVAAVKEARGL